MMRPPIRLQRNVVGITNSPTPTFSTDSYDTVEPDISTTIAITSMLSGLTGTPTNFQQLMVAIKNISAIPLGIVWGQVMKPHV